MDSETLSRYVHTWMVNGQPPPTPQSRVTTEFLKILNEPTNSPFSWQRFTSPKPAASFYVLAFSFPLYKGRPFPVYIPKILTYAKASENSAQVYVQEGDSESALRINLCPFDHWQQSSELPKILQQKEVTYFFFPPKHDAKRAKLIFSQTSSNGTILTALYKYDTSLIEITGLSRSTNQLPFLFNSLMTTDPWGPVPKSLSNKKP